MRRLFSFVDTTKMLAPRCSVLKAFVICARQALAI